MAKRPTPRDRGRYLDRKYSRVRYDFDRVGWIRSEIRRHLAAAWRTASARATQAEQAAAVRARAAAAGFRTALTRDAGPAPAPSLETVDYAP